MNTHRKILLIPIFLTALGLIGLTAGCDPVADAALEPPATAVSHGHDHDHSGHVEEGDVHDDHGHGEEAHADEVRLTPEAITRYGIEVGTAERTAPSASFTAPARIGFNTERMAHITTAVAGRVAELQARLGDRVEVGDVLLTLDSPELGKLQSEYLAQRTAVATAEPGVDLARAAYERAQNLYEQGGGVSLAETQRRQAELAAARRDLLTAEAALAAAANTLRLYGMSPAQIEQLAASSEVRPRCEIIAPIAGEVIEREVTLGELVGPGDKRLMVLADLSTLWALVDVAEAKLGQVGLGTRVTLALPALPGRVFEGEVTYIAPRIDPATRTARLRVEVANPDGLLRPGMFAQATVAVKGASGGERVLAVPVSAVMSVEGEPSVFVPLPGEPNTFARRSVVVGERVGALVPILAGLAEGDRVVTRGVFILKADLGKAGAEHVH